MDILKKYFPDLTPQQVEQFSTMQALYEHWNAQINVISRKDMENFYEHHVLHSLSIGIFFGFDPGERIMDLGTGGGFPGIPLAILFPETEFVLVDSIGKKIKVVSEVAAALKLQNVQARNERAEKVKGPFDYVVSRAVAPIGELFNWSRGKLKKDPNKEVSNGIMALKGGDMKEELSNFKRHIRLYPLSEIYEEPFFETKKLVYVPV